MSQACGPPPGDQPYQCPKCGFYANLQRPIEEDQVIQMTEGASSWYHCCRACLFCRTDCRGHQVPKEDGSPVPNQVWYQDDPFGPRDDAPEQYPAQYRDQGGRNLMKDWLGNNYPLALQSYQENRNAWPPNRDDHTSYASSNSNNYATLWPLRSSNQRPQDQDEYVIYGGYDQERRRATAREWARLDPMNLQDHDKPLRCQDCHRHLDYELIDDKFYCWVCDEEKAQMASNPTANDGSYQFSWMEWTRDAPPSRNAPQEVAPSAQPNRNASMHRNRCASRLGPRPPGPTGPPGPQAAAPSAQPNRNEPLLCQECLRHLDFKPETGYFCWWCDPDIADRVTANQAAQATASSAQPNRNEPPRCQDCNHPLDFNAKTGKYFCLWCGQEKAPVLWNDESYQFSRKEWSRDAPPLRNPSQAAAPSAQPNRNEPRRCQHCHHFMDFNATTGEYLCLLCGPEALKDGSYYFSRMEWTQDAPPSKNASQAAALSAQPNLNEPLRCQDCDLRLNFDAPTGLYSCSWCDKKKASYSNWVEWSRDAPPSRNPSQEAAPNGQPNRNASIHMNRYASRLDPLPPGPTGPPQAAPGRYKSFLRTKSQRQAGPAFPQASLSAMQDPRFQNPRATMQGPPRTPARQTPMDLQGADPFWNLRQEFMQAQMQAQMQGPPRTPARQEPMDPQGAAAFLDRCRANQKMRAQMQDPMQNPMHRPSRTPAPQAPMDPQGAYPVWDEPQVPEPWEYLMNTRQDPRAQNLGAREQGGAPAAPPPPPPPPPPGSPKKPRE